MESLESLRSEFSYNPETGVVTRLRTGKQVISVLKTGYARISVKGKQYKMHRFIWYFVHGVLPEQIDHINGDRSDNRLCNLRDVSYRENVLNLKLYPNNKSGCAGVNWHASGKWVAQIRDQGRYVYLGCFKELSDAVASRKAAEKRLGYHENHGTVRTRYPRD